MSVRMRHTSGHSANRRSHHKVTGPRLSTCNDCGNAHARHHVCANCGKYRGREVIDVKAQIEKKEAKMKARAAALGTEAKPDTQVEESRKSKNEPEPEMPVEEAHKPLDPAALSRNKS